MDLIWRNIWIVQNVVKKADETLPLAWTKAVNTLILISLKKINKVSVYAYRQGNSQIIQGKLLLIQLKLLLSLSFALLQFATLQISKRPISIKVQVLPPLFIVNFLLVFDFKFWGHYFHLFSASSFLYFYLNNYFCNIEYT